MTQNLSTYINKFEDRPTVAILGYADEINNPEKPFKQRWTKLFDRLKLNVKIITPRSNINTGTELSDVDALFLIGGDTNIHPDFMDRERTLEDGPHDYNLDFSALALARSAFQRQLPSVGVCLGMQYMAAAFGARIERVEHGVHNKNYEKVYGVKGNPDEQIKALDSEAHKIHITNGQLLTLFQSLCDPNQEISVNSAHRYGLTKENLNAPQAQAFRDNFQVEGYCPDDHLIEIFSANPDRHPFYYGWQPHIEIDGDMHKLFFKQFENAIVAHYNQRSETQPANGPETVAAQIAENTGYRRPVGERLQSSAAMSMLPPEVT